MTGPVVEADRALMRRALVEAARGRGSVEPNPMVGAVVVKEGHTLSVGHHARFGGPHAEVVALEAAGAAARGSTLYVTLEPCCHTGKTPPCTDAILRAGVARVVAAMRDPFPEVDGGGFEILRAAGVEVVSGVEEDPARRLNAPYLKRLATGLPYVIAKWAMTLDGKTATASGDSRWISGPRSRALVHELRGRMDAIVVGIGTALADDPALTARPPGPRTPARVVLDRSARLPLDGTLVRTARAVPVLVAVTPKAPADRIRKLNDFGCEILILPEDESRQIPSLLAELGRRGMTNVLVEGGGRVLGAFLDAGQVDAVDVYIAPVVEGGSHAIGPVRGLGVATMAEALRLDDVEIQVIDGDVRVRGTIRRGDRPGP
ncbi:MAG TPA: bifunctional diaminohydroxyphosphoribosylaminopyrimidine deaminase/5-amino-6-(5-phosphoribosylamino)uracil reductase RibD [Isosphaeraceae bacterium]|jgi:diaminohydroxyphosphoribosylaminopyrimidine deaminase/5-amino-6-(5-phosphoribosylamino)uracil reductase|nr:bifunctional diaminohydroxyphosphoribosylaminopyrimidine deaminase/5-amino-6-(5-phosphoribosylamino)uracil reductase RibD [Isosphaeraceae bacterium]